MAKLMVDYDGLAQNKNDIIKQKDQFDETVKALENIITDIQNNWVGQAADAYAEQFQSLKSDGLAKVDELLQTISDNYNLFVMEVMSLIATWLVKLDNSCRGVYPPHY